MGFPTTLYMKLAEERHRTERSADQLMLLLLTQAEAWDTLASMACTSNVRFSLDDCCINISISGARDDLDDVLAELGALGFKLKYGSLPTAEDAHWAKYLVLPDDRQSPRVWLMWDLHARSVDPAREEPEEGSLADLLAEPDVDDDIPF